MSSDGITATSVSRINLDKNVEKNQKGEIQALIGFVSIVNQRGDYHARYKAVLATV